MEASIDIMAFIRPFRETDSEAMARICRETLPASLSSAQARRIAPYIWAHNYTFLSPQTCFVVDDGSGSVVGYCIGCADVEAFCAGYAGYVAAVLEPAGLCGGDGDDEESEEAKRLRRWAREPERLLVDGHDDVAAEGFRSTMHIDILPEWQGRGWGRRLIAVFAEGVRGAGVETRGVWIGVAGDNAGVVPFYEKQGFVRRHSVGKSTCLTLEL